MACTTCDHAMQGIGYGRYWCPRCGTLKSHRYGESAIILQPKLVARARKFIDEVCKHDCELPRDFAHTIGLLESIYPEGSRER